MTNLLTRPLDESIALWWKSIDPSSRRAFFVAIMVSVMAFGFEMTNLTLHHDDVFQIFIQHEKYQQYVGRFGFGWLYYYTQGAHFMPFVQMLEGIGFMAACGVIAGRVWGLRGTMELALVAAVIGVFPYVAQMYQHNTAMALYPLAHLLAAAAVALSIRSEIWSRLAAVLLYVTAFSIYQSVLACALAIWAVWALVTVSRNTPSEASLARTVFLPSAVALICLGLGGVLYMASVRVLGLELTSEHGADAAFRLEAAFAPLTSVKAVLDGSRASYLWPENYYPLLLKRVSLVVLVTAGVFSVWAPKKWSHKLAAAILFLLLLLAPRALQFIHPTGKYHNLTLTGYAVVAAGALAIIYRTGPVLVKNAASIAAIVLLAGYVVQANWISTVGYLNTIAHYSQATQILARVRSLPNAEWDGNTIVVAGSLRLYDDYPFKRATGVATDFLDAGHLQLLTRLLRDPVRVLSIGDATPTLQESAASLPPWPHPSSVSVADGVALVVLGRPQVVTTSPRR